MKVYKTRYKRDDSGREVLVFLDENNNIIGEDLFNTNDVCIRKARVRGNKVLIRHYRNDGSLLSEGITFLRGNHSRLKYSRLVKERSFYSSGKLSTETTFTPHGDLGYQKAYSLATQECYSYARWKSNKPVLRVQGGPNNSMTIVFFNEQGLERQRTTLKPK